MAEAWEQWHGEVVGGEFRLRQYLGGSDHSAVFLADRNRDPQPVVLKLVPSHPATDDSQMASWERVAKLNHRCLLRILGSGRCQLGNSPFLYAVIERADENLAQILPQRALTQRETGDMLRPVLEGLDYLHTNGFAHGHIAPSNILAVGDQIKLSTDTASTTGQVPAANLDSSENDLPLSERAGVSKTADIWSLGATLVEVLTQRRTAWEETAHGEPLFREKLPEPFREIAKRCLNRNPARRPSVEEIQKSSGFPGGRNAADCTGSCQGIRIPPRHPHRRRGSDGSAGHCGMDEAFVPYSAIDNAIDRNSAEAAEGNAARIARAATGDRTRARNADGIQTGGTSTRARAFARNVKRRSGAPGCSERPAVGAQYDHWESSRGGQS